MYEIIYDFDECVMDEDFNIIYYDEIKNLREMFEGTHIELLEHIKLMREAGCYNISAEAIPEYWEVN